MNIMTYEDGITALLDYFARYSNTLVVTLFSEDTVAVGDESPYITET